MNKTIRILAASLSVMLLIGTAAQAQLRNLQNFRPNDKNGINVFESPKASNGAFQGLTVLVGGDFAIQLQGLSQSNDANDLVELSNNFTLPTANLNLDVQLEEGVRLHMRTYLSARHHTEAWVKGGYLQIDNLDFISEGFLAEVMEVARFKFGMNDINYGDTHFRRSDNARTIFNPFVSNYLMDSFSTEPFAEVSVLKSGFIGVLGLTNGRLNQKPTPGDDGVSVYVKVGYDNQVSDDLRVRLTGSLYKSSDKSTRDYIYGGDRAGSRYYQILYTADEGGDFDPRFNPGFPNHTAIQINPFVKFMGLEVFGVIEMTSNGADAGGSYTQLGAEALYRFGPAEKVYLGGRFNSISGESSDGGPKREISRVNIGGGWFMTNNVLAKIEYVTSTYDGAGWTGRFAGAQYDGFVIEAVIGF